MADFDLPDSTPPTLEPLRQSFEPGDYRDAIKQITLDLFDAHLGTRAFDANVLGAAHLGSFGLVRRFIQADGLGMLRADRVEAATRYLYRAWQAGDTQGRGLHFLRTYLQLLFPDQHQLAQLWHDKRFDYGTAFRRNEPRPKLWHFLGEPGLKIDGEWKVGKALITPGEAPEMHYPNPDHLWLTSRIQVILDIEVLGSSPAHNRSAFNVLFEILRSTLPARLIPEFVFWISMVLDFRVTTRQQLMLRKHVSTGFPWCGRSVSAHPDRRWSLGVDGQYVALPEAFGSFRVGERRGHVSVWHLRGCRAEQQLILRKHSAARAYRLPIIGEADRRLDGTWAIDRRQADALTRSALRVHAAAPKTLETRSRWVEHFRLLYPYTPKSLDQDRTLDGYWRLGLRAPKLGQPFHGRKLGRALSAEQSHTDYHVTNEQGDFTPLHISDGAGGFIPYRVKNVWALGRNRPGIITEVSRFTRKPSWVVSVAPVRLAGDRLTGWPLGGFRLPKATLALRKHTDIDQPLETAGLLRLKQHARLTYPAEPQHLTRLVRLGKRWKVGLNAPALGSVSAPKPLNGWALAAYPGIRALYAQHVRKRSTLYLAPWQLGHGRRLDGRKLGDPIRPSVTQGSRFAIDSDTQLASRARLRQRITLNYPATAQRLTRLNTLGSGWRLQPGRTIPHARQPVPLNGGFVLPRPVSILAE